MLTGEKPSARECVRRGSALLLTLGLLGIASSVIASGINPESFPLTNFCLPASGITFVGLVGFMMTSFQPSHNYKDLRREAAPGQQGNKTMDITINQIQSFRLAQEA